MGDNNFIQPDNNFGLNEIGTDTDSSPNVGESGSVAGYLHSLRDMFAAGTAGVTAAVTASISGFTPNGDTSTPLSVTNSSSNVALPTGATMAVVNTGSATAYVALGTTNAVTATVDDLPVAPGAAVGLTVGLNTYLAAITATGTATLNIAGGAGLLTGFGGGTSSGGGGGNDSVGATGTTAPTSATEIGIIVTGDLVGVSSSNPMPASDTSTHSALSSIATDLGTINTTLGSPMQNSGGSIATVTTITDAVTVAQATAASLNATVVTTGGAALAKETGGNLATLAGIVSGSVAAVSDTTTHTDLGTINTSLGTINTTLGSPMQTSGGSVTANAGTNLNTSLLATDAHLTSFSSANHTDLEAINTTLGSPFQAGANIGNTSFGATQGTASNLNATVVTTGGAEIATNAELTTVNTSLGTINTTLGTPMQNSGGSVTANAGTNLNTSLLATDAHLTSFSSQNHTDLGTISTTLGTPMQNSGGSVSITGAPTVTGTGTVGSPAVGVISVAHPDYLPASINVTAADSASSTTTGQNNGNIITGAATANSTASFAVNGTSNVKIQVSGTWSGTLEFEISNDSGTTWYPKTGKVVGTAYRQTSITANGLFSFDAAGITNIRVRATAFASGTAVVLPVVSGGTSVVEINNPVSIGDNSSGNSAAIKSASTAALATDTSLVVALSPNSALPSGGASVAVTPTVTAGAYTAGWQVGGIMHFANVLSPAFLGLLESLTLIFKGSVQTTQFDLWLFNASPSNGTYVDANAPTWNAADAANLIGCYPLTASYNDLGTMTIYNLDAIGKQIVGASQGLYAILISRSATNANLGSTSDVSVLMATAW